jgi:hypothetical protein
VLEITGTMSMPKPSACCDFVVGKVGSCGAVPTRWRNQVPGALNRQRRVPGRSFHANNFRKIYFIPPNRRYLLKRHTCGARAICVVCEMRIFSNMPSPLCFSRRSRRSLRMLARGVRVAALMRLFRAQQATACVGRQTLTLADHCSATIVAVQPRSPPLTKIRPGTPAPANGPGTLAYLVTLVRLITFAGETVLRRGSQGPRLKMRNFCRAEVFPRRSDQHEVLTAGGV